MEGTHLVERMVMCYPKTLHSLGSITPHYHSQGPKKGPKALFSPFQLLIWPEPKDLDDDRCEGEDRIGKW